METIQKIALVFTIIGALNWGIIALFDVNLVTAISNDNTVISNLVYGIVGICGLINIGLLFNKIRRVD